MMRLVGWSSVVGSMAGLAIAATGCAVEQQPAPQELAEPSLESQLAAPQTSSQPAPEQNYQNVLQQALDKAYSAASLAQSARSGEDWELVANRWKRAIALLKQIPGDRSQYPLAQEKIVEYQQNLTYAQTQAKTAAASVPEVPAAILIKPVAKVPPKSPAPVRPRTDGVFRTKIKRREGGTPVIDVRFNESQTFEMIVDTGATGIVVTQAMAQSLNIPIVGSAIMDTASEKGITVPVGWIESVAVDGLVARDLPVIIAGAQLEIGLLGQDFFGDYDLTIRQDSIEFQQR
ncbi:retropepsin-like aspartic protease family protein [Roseofilum casamattae]|uniref:Retropepsin-like aspartic protease n=1 Tax=Roseofilum casamattae BLCC-M143 TaxID=3022442 RepID=A0ABT7BXI4_9CYAN|nr:retropepsin-like aspartic protease [Roseofilum casamattae]MDJ1183902.1 retropepsin-like aspartic protease [Roseofilum casamattae BLCC-M143]